MAGKQMVSTNNPPLNSNLFDFRFIAGCLLISWLLHCRICTGESTVASSHFESCCFGSYKVHTTNHHVMVQKFRVTMPQWQRIDYATRDGRFRRWPTACRALMTKIKNDGHKVPSHACWPNRVWPTWFGVLRRSRMALVLSVYSLNGKPSIKPIRHY